jgi:hypothetical protein
MVQLPDYWLPRPVGDPSPKLRAAFDAIWQLAVNQGGNPLIGDAIPGTKWEFLCHLADAHGLALHGSGDANIAVFEPRQATDLQEFGNRRAVYAAGDGIWAMFFAVVDRERIGSVTNACVRLADASGQVGAPHYLFSISRKALPLRPWRTGTVYVMPGDTFEVQPPIPFGDYEARIPQLASLVPVTPLARVSVEPEDFPFLADIRGHDDERLAEYARALESGAPWPD